MLLHTFRNDDLMTRTSVHKLGPNADGYIYFRVIHIDDASGEIVGSVNRATLDEAMEYAKQCARGEVLPGDMSPGFLPDMKKD